MFHIFEGFKNFPSEFSEIYSLDKFLVTMENVDYYEVLGVECTADESVIKKAYHNLAMTCHPDKVLEDKENAHSQFQLINQAYQTLSDKAQRRSYGMTRRMPKRVGSYNTTRFGQFDRLYDSIYNKKPPKPHRASSYSIDDIVIQVICTLEDMYQLVTKRFDITRVVDGINTIKTFNITLTPGISNGTVIPVKGYGNKRTGESPGDLYFVIVELSHEIFKRDGANIIEEVDISLAEALTGIETTRIGIDGQEVHLKIDDVIIPNQEFRVHGRGLPKEDGTHGDLIFVFNVNFPKKLTEEQKQIVRRYLM